jgi:hypothetical protein
MTNFEKYFSRGDKYVISILFTILIHTSQLFKVGCYSLMTQNRSLNTFASKNINMHISVPFPHYICGQKYRQCEKQRTRFISKSISGTVLTGLLPVFIINRDDIALVLLFLCGKMRIFVLF